MRRRVTCLLLHALVAVRSVASMRLARSVALRSGAALVAQLAALRSGAAPDGGAGSWRVGGNALYDATRKEACGLASVVDAARRARVIFAGEEHTSAAHHAFAADLAAAVDDVDAAPTLVGLEMCYRQHQPFLDAYVFGTPAAGGGDVERLASRTDWASTWGSALESITGRRPAWDTFKPLYLAQIELVFHDS